MHTESEEKLVVYQSVDNPDRVFARPLEMFMSDIDRFRYPLIRAKYRFTLVSEPEEETNGEETKEEETKEETLNEDTRGEDVKDEETEEQSDDDSAVYKDNGELVIDPYVEGVLDEKEFSKKIEFFEMLRGKCTEDMLTTIAISLDIQLQEGSIEDKYSQILRTLKMHEKYETSRLRG